MTQSLKINDTVKIIAGENKGKTAKVVKIDRKNRKVMIEGINVRTRHLKRTQFNPAGGKKEIHVGIDFSNVKLEKAAEPANKAKKKENK